MNALVVEVRITSIFHFEIEPGEKDSMDMEYVRNMTNGEDPAIEMVHVSIGTDPPELWDVTP